jgi:hypothetical protein
MVLVLMSSAVVGCTVLMSQALRWLGLVLLSSVVIGCTALMSHAPMTKTAQFPDTPDAAYQRATRACLRMGCQVTHANAQLRTLSGTVHNAVVLNVIISPTATGSQIEATGTVMSNKIALGSFDEVESYMVLLQE